jgi:hypothetical protein
MGYTLDVFSGSDTGKAKQDQVNRPLRSIEVLLDITHVSTCGTDGILLHSSQVLGYEICGACKNCIAGIAKVL